MGRAVRRWAEIQKTGGKDGAGRYQPLPLHDGGAAGKGPAGGKKVVQFNWRRHWKRKVAPHLHKELVQASVDLGMMLLDDNWRHGDPPHLLGREPWRRAIPGKRKRSRVE